MMRRKSIVYLGLAFFAPLVGAILMLGLRANASQAAPAQLPDLAVFTYRTDHCVPGVPHGSPIPRSPMTPGSDVVYVIHVSNPTPYSAQDVIIDSWLPISTTYVSSWEYYYEYPWEQAGFLLIQAGPDRVVWVRPHISPFVQAWICVKAHVAADVPVGALVESETSVSTLDPEESYNNNEYVVWDYVLPPEPDVIVKTDLYSGTLEPGGEITYRVAYMNKGGATAHGVTITDTLPLSATFVSESHPVSVTAVLTGSTVVWTLPPLEGYFPEAGRDLTPSANDLYLTVHLSDDFDPAHDWLTGVAEIATSDAEYSTLNNLSRFTVKPEGDKRYGAAVTSVDDQTMRLLNDGGFDWMEVYLDWSQAEPVDDQYDWRFIDDAIWKAYQYNIKLAVRVDRAPAWARSGGTDTAPPSNPALLGDFMQALASRTEVPPIDAFIVWNEPNLAAEWGGDPPDAAAYTALLQAAYTGVKAGNPDALVVSAGLAPTNGDPPNAVDDRVYLQQTYDAGAGSYFDRLGVMPFGFASAPDDVSDPDGYHFSRALEWRAIMETNGDGAKQMFATEMGWLRDSSNDLGSYNWMKVSDIDQAHYLARAYHKARLEWVRLDETPWMGPMMVWNLDFAEFYTQTNHFHWFAVTDDDRTPLRSYYTLQNAATLGPADLWLEKELISGGDAGEDLVYHISYTNIGGQPAAGVVLTDTLPPGTIHVGDSRGDGVAVDGGIVWDLGLVEAGARETITVTLRLDDGAPGGILTNTAEISAVPGEPYVDDNVAAPELLVADLYVSKSASPQVVDPGETITYTLTFSNLGQTVASGVLITDVVPAFLMGVDYASSGAAVTPTGAISYTWQVADLAPGEGGIITVTGVVSPSLPQGYDLSNTVTITASVLDGDPSNNRSTARATTWFRVYLPLVLRNHIVASDPVGYD
jgi:uncharacterized repeat protein (TIGR01451 family)